MGLAGQKHFGLSAQLNSAHASKIQEAAGCWLVLETKAILRFAKVSIVSYSRPSLMIIALASQFHVYLPWGQRPFSIVS